MRPSVFIASSSEQLDVAEAIHVNLAREAETYLWPLSFEKSVSVFEQLLNFKDKFDFAVLVLNPDDTSQVRGKNYDLIETIILLSSGYSSAQLGLNVSSRLWTNVSTTN